jgi:CHAT domain-containing protein
VGLPILKPKSRLSLSTTVLASVTVYFAGIIGSTGLRADPQPPPERADLSQGDLLFQQGNQAYQARDWETAIARWQAALEHYQGQPRSKAQVLAQLGALYTELERYREAIARFEQLNGADLDPSPWAQAQANWANAYHATGRHGRAIALHKQAGKQFLALGDRRSAGRVLLNLGNSWLALGNYREASEIYQYSLSLARETQDRPAQMQSLANLGSALAYQNQPQQAETLHRQSLAIAESTGDLTAQANGWLNLGMLYHRGAGAARQLQQARQAYERSLTLARQGRAQLLESKALGSLGILAQDLGTPDLAVRYHQQSLAIAQTLDNPIVVSSGLNNLGHTYYRQGQFALAEAQIRRAIAQMEAVRAQASVPGQADRVQISLFDTQVHSYNLLTQVLVAAQQPEAALVASEQGRAQVFAQSLSQRLVERFGERLDKRLEAGPPPSPPFILASLQALARQHRATLVEYSIVPDEAFSFLGKQRGREQTLLIWVVQPSGQIHLRQVDLRALWARGLSLSQVVTQARCFAPTPNCRLTPGPTRGLTVIPDPAPISQPSSAELSQSGLDSGQSLQLLHSLLIAPIQDLLPADPDQPVVMVPQDVLFLVPFAALQAKPQDYLIAHHTLVTIPSLAVLGLTQQRLAALRSGPRLQGRNQRAQALGQQVLVVGNPQMPPVPGAIPRPLPPLPGAALEAEAIAQLWQTQPLIGSLATELTVRQRLVQASLIHLATHGLLDYGAQLGELQLPGAIALAPSPALINPTSSASPFSAFNQSPSDGLLSAEELLDLRINAQLVVLSACDTGQGTITGDGVVGLSRALITAGAPQVLVSLWPVPDRPTSLLMQQFHSRLREQTTAQALRQAMLQLQQRYPNPENWAAFSLLGALE